MQLLFLTAVAQQPQKAIVYFPFGKYYVTNAAAETLESLAKTNRYAQIDSIRILAFCDSVGNYEANDTLALQRAATVKTYLQQRSISSSNFKTVIGYGKRLPANNNANDSLRALNRRAEIYVYTRAGNHNTNDSLRAKMLSAKAGDKFTLSNFNFYGGRHLLLPSSLPILDTLYLIMKTVPQLEIEIQGYVCCVPVGTEGYDMDTQQWQLSYTRARTVYNYLVNKGIAANRLTYKGYGNNPLVKEVTEQDRTTNRRVEIKVTKR